MFSQTRQASGRVGGHGPLCRTKALDKAAFVHEDLEFHGTKTARMGFTGVPFMLYCL